MGNFIEWFTSTFGTGSYQLWYYNSDKSYFLYDVDTSLFMLIQAITTDSLFDKIISREGYFFYNKTLWNTCICEHDRLLRCK